MTNLKNYYIIKGERMEKETLGKQERKIVEDLISDLKLALRDI